MTQVQLLAGDRRPLQGPSNTWRHRSPSLSVTIFAWETHHLAQLYRPSEACEFVVAMSRQPLLISFPIL